MFFAGIGLLCAVPVFKTLTHLPPFMGILFALGILWLAGELIHGKKRDVEKEYLTLASALQRIDMASLVFFIGILLSVATLEHSHILSSLAGWLDRTVGNLHDAPRVSRIDLFVDFVSPVDMESWDRHAWVTRAHSVNQYAVDGQFSGWTVGSGGVVSARLYNKLLELENSKKFYLIELWQRAGWEGASEGVYGAWNSSSSATFWASSICII